MSTKDAHSREAATSGQTRDGKRAAVRALGDRADPEEIMIAANSHLVRQYPFGCLAGTPRHLTLGSQELWIVPIILTSVGYGAVGEVGVVALDAHTQQMLGGTPPDEVVATVKHLKEEKRDELEAAFHRARKARYLCAGLPADDFGSPGNARSLGSASSLQDFPGPRRC